MNSERLEILMKRLDSIDKRLDNMAEDFKTIRHSQEGLKSNLIGRFDEVKTDIRRLKRLTCGLERDLDETITRVNKLLE